MENFEQIEGYILGRLSESEKKDFEQRIQGDPSLATEVNTIRELILAVETKGLRKNLSARKIGASGQLTDNVVSIQPKKRSLIKYLAAASSIAAVFIIGIWFLQPGSGTQEQFLAEAFYSDPGLPTPMSETNNYNFYDAMVDYKMEKYDVALEKWKNVTTGIGPDTLNYYKGMALLNQGKLEESVTYLDRVNAESALFQKASWYKVKVLIDKKNYKEAKLQLQQIQPNLNPKYEALKHFLESK